MGVLRHCYWDTRKMYEYSGGSRIMAFSRRREWIYHTTQCAFGMFSCLIPPC